MTIDELSVLLNERKDFCKKFNAPKFEHCIGLSVPVPEAWVKKGFAKLRTKTPFGMCRCYPVGNRIFIYPTFEQVESFLKKAKQDIKKKKRVGF